jgi:hypothetical protein
MTDNNDLESVLTKAIQSVLDGEPRTTLKRGEAREWLQKILDNEEIDNENTQESDA